MLCRLYLRMKIKRVVVEEQIQWVLLYVQEELTDIWKENMLEDLKIGMLEYEIVREFLADIRKKFSRKDKESVKVVELKKLEQGEKIMEEYIQKFRKATKKSNYKGRFLVEEFK